MVKADLVLQIRRLCSSVGEHGVIKKQMASKIEQQAARIAELEQSASGQLKVTAPLPPINTYTHTPLSLNQQEQIK